MKTPKRLKGNLEIYFRVLTMGGIIVHILAIESRLSRLKPAERPLVEAGKCFRLKLGILAGFLTVISDVICGEIPFLQG